MTAYQFPVDGERLRMDIERNAQFGGIDTDDGWGRTVLPGTEPNREARKHLVERMIHADLAVRVDAVGNIVGTWAPEGCDPEAAAVAAGSHLDSVPNGGIFDGPLGVYAALESIRAMQDADVSVFRPVEVVCFTGEEGTRFADGVLGSSVAAGLLDTDTALGMTDGTETVREALQNIGFHGEGRVDASDWHAWLELHVEQSERLERLGVPAGVVTSISGTTRLQITIEGETDHSGTTAMADRTDALAAASEFVLTMEQAANEATERSDAAVATVGELSVEPGAVNVIPGRVDLSVDIRDVNQSVIEGLVDRAEKTLNELEANRGVTTLVERPYDIPPTDMAPVCRDALHDAGEAVGAETVDVYSGAGHDSMQVASVTDAGLLFAPSKEGHSHNKWEWTPWEACAITADILTAAIGDLAGCSAVTDDSHTNQTL